MAQERLRPIFGILGNLVRITATEARNGTTTPGSLAQRRRDGLVLIPSPDHYAIMAAFGVRANEQEMNTREIIAWLREFEQNHPFRLRSCKFDGLGIELTQPLDDPKLWAKKLQEFDYDMWPDEDLTYFEKQLETLTRLNFWWD